MELVLHDMLDCLQLPIRILMFFYVTTWKTREQGKEKLHWIPAHHPSFLNLILNWFSMCKYLILQLFSARKQVESQNSILIFVSIELWFCFWPMGVGEDVLLSFNSICFFCKVNVSTERKRDISFLTALYPRLRLYIVAWRIIWNCSLAPIHGVTFPHVSRSLY